MTTRFKLKLTRRDGNAFAILGRFQGAARKAGWTDEEVRAVMEEAMSGDYTNLLRVMGKYADVS